jgi:endonuclease III
MDQAASEGWLGPPLVSLSPAYSWQDVIDLLNEQHGPVSREPPPLGNKVDPYDELIYILLTVMTRSQPRIDRAYEGLRDLTGGGGWAALVGADRDALRRVLEPLGIVNRRTEQLLSIIAAIESIYGGSLEHMRQLTTEDALAELTGLAGVGTKTAKCVMMYSLGFEILPTDIHVLRVAKRLGFVDEASTWAAADQQLEAEVPAGLKYDVHVHLVQHGREICKGPNPRCSDCLLQPGCPVGSLAPRLRSHYAR